MADGIETYCSAEGQDVFFIGTDVQDRGYENSNWELHYELDFLADDYPIEQADVIIMNPPYATLEPFFIRALEIAQDKLIVLCRTQAIEGEGRWKNIFSKYPFTYMYQYVNRIQCWKNGEKPEGSSAQAYCWLVWDKAKTDVEPTLKWIKRKD